MQQDIHEQVKGWFTGRLPDGWFVSAPEITVDREEVLVVGRVDEPGLEGDATDAAKAAAAAARIKRFREETRGQRMRMADEAEHLFGRKVSWGAECGERRELFTTVSVPVMTRLRQPERMVLDLLVEAGVARSRSDALAWCVKLVGANEEAYLERLSSLMEGLRKARAEGPKV